MNRRVCAFSGILRAAGERATSFDHVRHGLALSDRPRSGLVCYVPTGVGDSELAVATTRGRFAEHERPLPPLVVHSDLALENGHYSPPAAAAVHMG